MSNELKEKSRRKLIRQIMKTHQLYFIDAAGCKRRLDKFPETFELVFNQFQKLLDTYHENNIDTLFSKPSSMTLSKARFERVQNELRLTNIIVTFYCNSTTFFTLKAIKN